MNSTRGWANHLIVKSTSGLNSHIAFSRSLKGIIRQALKNLIRQAIKGRIRPLKAL